MSLKLGVLSLVALLIVILLAFKNYEIWTQPIEWVPEKEGVKKTEKNPETPPITGGKKGTTSIQSYVAISGKNIFHPERKDFPIPTSGTDLLEKSLGRPKIILYGVAIKGDYQSATITHLGKPLQKGEREMITLRMGDSLGEYKLSKILPDRIIMEGMGESFEVLLYDPKVVKKRIAIKTETKPSPAEVSKPTPPQVTTERPREPIKEGITEPQMPKPVTPAPVPYRGIRRRPIPSAPIGPTGSAETPQPGETEGN